LEATGREEYEEWKDHYEKRPEEYTKTIRVESDTSVNRCVKYNKRKFIQITSDSFKIEALGDEREKLLAIKNFLLIKSTNWEVLNDKKEPIYHKSNKKERKVHR
jgi:hypothetical protein